MRADLRLLHAYRMQPYCYLVSTYIEAHSSLTTRNVRTRFIQGNCVLLYSLTVPVYVSLCLQSKCKRSAMCLVFKENASKAQQRKYEYVHALSNVHNRCAVSVAYHAFGICRQAKGKANKRPKSFFLQADVCEIFLGEL